MFGVFEVADTELVERNSPKLERGRLRTLTDVSLVQFLCCRAGARAWFLRIVGGSKHFDDLRGVCTAREPKLDFH
ncbi:MAG: hypothetical protein AAF574_12275 [Pseudomonadota bacterium]